MKGSMQICNEEETREEMPRVPLSDRLLMIGTAFLWLFLPCVAVLLVIAFLVMFCFGIL